jgi:hypothetical protein
MVFFDTGLSFKWFFTFLIVSLIYGYSKYFFPEPQFLYGILFSSTAYFAREKNFYELDIFSLCFCVFVHIPIHNLEIAGNKFNYKERSKLNIYNGYTIFLKYKAFYLISEVVLMIVCGYKLYMMNNKMIYFIVSQIIGNFSFIYTYMIYEKVDSMIGYFKFKKTQLVYHMSLSLLFGLCIVCIIR